MIEADINSMNVFNFSAVYPDYFNPYQAFTGLPYKETLFSRVPPRMANNYYWMADYPAGDNTTLDQEFGDTTEEKTYSRYCRKLSWGMHFSAAEDWSSNGGKVIYETYYDGQGNKQLETHYEYQQLFAGNGYYVNAHPYVPSTLILGHANIVRIPLYSNLPIRKTITEYGQNGESFQVTEHTVYDTEGYKVSESKTSPDGSSLIKTYSRVKDLTDSVSVVMQFINNVSPLVTEDWTDSTGTYIYRRKNTFENRQDVSYPVLGKVALSYDSSAPTVHIQYPVYNSYGRIVQGEEDGVKTVYLWSYRGQYLVAIIENADAEQVRQALGVSSLSDLSSDDSPNYSALNALRNALPGSRVTTYKYLHGTGLCESVGPDGFKTYYSYDANGRLESISVDDESGLRSTVSSYEYHLVND